MRISESLIAAFGSEQTRTDLSLATHLFALYQAGAEAFDRRLPGCWMRGQEGGTWMPHDRRASMKFASQFYARIRCWLSYYGVPAAVSKAAQAEVGAMSDAMQRQMAEAIQVTEDLKGVRFVINGVALPPAVRS